MTRQETEHNTTKYNDRGLEICTKCRSYRITQRHHDICEKGMPYYDFVERDGAEIHQKVI